MTERDSDSAHWRLGPDVVAEQVGDDMVLVHLKTDRIYRLNLTGSRIWQLLAGGMDLAQARETLAAEFAVEPSVLDREVRDLVVQLEVSGLVQCDERP